MATIKQGILGGFSKSLNLIGNGVLVLKGLERAAEEGGRDHAGLGGPNRRLGGRPQAHGMVRQGDEHDPAVRCGQDAAEIRRAGAAAGSGPSA